MRTGICNVIVTVFSNYPIKKSNKIVVAPAELEQEIESTVLKVAVPLCVPSSQ